VARARLQTNLLTSVSGKILPVTVDAHDAKSPSLAHTAKVAQSLLKRQRRLSASTHITDGCAQQRPQSTRACALKLQ